MFCFLCTTGIQFSMLASPIWQCYELSGASMRQWNTTEAHTSRSDDAAELPPCTCTLAATMADMVCANGLFPLLTAGQRMILPRQARDKHSRYRESSPNMLFIFSGQACCGWTPPSALGGASPLRPLCLPRVCHLSVPPHPVTRHDRGIPSKR